MNSSPNNHSLVARTLDGGTIEMLLCNSIDMVAAEMIRLYDYMHVGVHFVSVHADLYSLLSPHDCLHQFTHLAPLLLWDLDTRMVLCY